MGTDSSHTASERQHRHSTPLHSKMKTWSAKASTSPETDVDVSEMSALFENLQSLAGVGPNSERKAKDLWIKSFTYEYFW